MSHFPCNMQEWIGFSQIANEIAAVPLRFLVNVG
jgi:hypothetical protein